MLRPQRTVVEVLQDRWWIGLVAMAISLVLTPVFRLIAYRTRIVDRPDDLLKPHGRPIAYLGGVGICLGLLGGLLCHVLRMPNLAGQWREIGENLAAWDMLSLLSNPLWRVTGIGLACIVITIVGLLDDIYSISPRKKILGQVLAAAILLMGGVGIRMAGIVLPSWLFEVSYGLWIVVPVSVVAVLILVIAACNATNLLDGLDGLCGGVTGIIALGFLGLAVWLAMWAHVPGTDELRIALCLAMAGAVLGFLPYNIPPASIFMGDAGSMLLGFFVATAMVLFCRERNARWFVAACAVFALPILDTALAVVRRLRMKRGIFAGDRSHLYDQLVDRGMSVLQVVVLFYILATIAAVAGVAIAIMIPGRYAVLVYAGAIVVIWGVFFALGMVTPPPREKSPPAVGGEKPH